EDIPEPPLASALTPPTATVAARRERTTFRRLEPTPRLIEQAGNRLLGGGARDRFPDQSRNRQQADIASDLDSLGRLDRVGNDQFLEAGGGDARDRAAREHAVGDVGIDRGCAFID